MQLDRIRQDRERASVPQLGPYPEALARHDHVVLRLNGEAHRSGGQDGLVKERAPAAEGESQLSGCRAGLGRGPLGHF